MKETLDNSFRPESKVRGPRSLEARKKNREAKLKQNGAPPDLPGILLDEYIAGGSVAQMARDYGRARRTIYSIISTEALFRIMKKQDAEHLDEVDM